MFNPHVHCTILLFRSIRFFQQPILAGVSVELSPPRDPSLKPLVLGFQKSQIRTVLLPEVEANTSAWLELQEEIEVHAVVVLFKCMDTDGVVPGRGVATGWVEIDEWVWWGYAHGGSIWG